MDDYDASTYGDRIAERYDEWYQELPYGGDLDAAVEFLRERAGDGPALELGIGTGRIALPLRAAGVDVEGVDASEAMVDRLRRKPGGAEIPVTIADFRDLELERRYRLVYVVFNTFFALQTQDDQVACFERVGAHLEPGGVFAMESFVPDLTRFTNGQNVTVTEIGLDQVRLDVSRHDAVEQRTTAQHVVFDEDGVRLYPVRIRYAYPSELDLMARLAGLRLHERWGDWDRTAFGGTSMKHISVWQRPSG